jgi:hypothetical protein
VPEITLILLLYLSEFKLSPARMNSAHMVVMEMSLAFFGIVFNLVVLISVREKESLLNSTVNVVLANLGRIRETISY